MSLELQNKLQETKNPYGDGVTSDKIIKITKDFMKNNKLNLKKKFYDIF